MQKKAELVNIIGIILSLFCLASMYVFPDTVQKCAFNAVKICGKSVIPSLFPYIVITRLFLHFFSDSIKVHQNFCKSIKNKMFYISLLLGLISGFPTGAVIACQMYSQGFITDKETEKVAVYSSVASPSFCINFFGNAIMNNRLSGLIVYIASVTVNLLLLAVADLFFKDSDNKGNYKICHVPEKSDQVQEIIYDSLMTMLTICAYVTFFMCIGEITYKVFSYFVPQIKYFKTVFFGIFEMTSGIAVLENTDFAQRMLYGGCIIGFGGLSSVMQIYSVCSKYNITCKKIFLTKTISAIFVPFVSFLLTVVYGILSLTHEKNKDLLFLITTTFAAFITVTFAYFIIKTIKNIRKAK